QKLDDDMRLEVLSSKETKERLEQISRAKGLRIEDCNYPRCLAEIGQDLGVERVVTGSLDDLDGTCYVILNLINVLSKQEDGFVRQYCSCQEEGFREALDAASRKLVLYVEVPYLPPSPLTGTLLSAPTSTPRRFQGGFDGMIFIPAGDFFMGSNQGAADEKPVRSVYLNAYYIDPYEVTNAQYEKFEKATGYRSKGWWRDYYSSGKENHPVVAVTWEDANAYAQWLGKRLPTEAEWEKAARGPTMRIWPWGNVFEPKRTKSSRGGANTVPIGSYEGGKSPYQVYDMAGNVAEWCADWYDENFYATGPNINPIGPSSGKKKVVRGGAFIHDKSKLTTSTRLAQAPEEYSPHIGFRCVRSGLPPTR
ncbi:MAG: formylglycine-generating enzyme family protein, partial [Candidatus Binatia bacterium]